ncbi:Beta-hexosaminidase [Sphaceloma murrayae]|uniref:Beta-hexosaminidase n=1 Tax=Sphaceloma murrayae TaxID=2082308 RepID=A0A2K1QHH6_9PEZI|nr:Beta-hexosaminidase [Sphaceloma murrayae]
MIWLHGFAVLSLVAHVQAIWPLPVNQSLGTSVVLISSKVKFEYVLQSNQVLVTRRPSLVQSLRSQFPQTGPAGYGRSSEPPSVVTTAIDSARKTIFSQNFYPWRLRPRNTPFDPPVNASLPVISSIALVQTSPDPADISTTLLPASVESYTLSLTASGEVTLTSPSSHGLGHALNTLTQLFYLTASSQAYTPFAPATISDAPLFPHRGLNLDVARSFFSPASIKRQIDALAYVKMNRLHLHITDSQSWPLEIPGLPLLSERGRYAPGLTYSPETLRDLQQYGRDRAVQVYLEIDMPGHTAIIERAYPGLVVAYDLPDWDKWALQPPSGALKLNSTAVDEFLERLFDDILPRAKEGSGTWHLGGDEVLPVQYLLEDGVGVGTREGVRPFMQRFLDRWRRRVEQEGLAVVVWEEMLLEWELGVGKDTVVQCWKGAESVSAAVAKGQKVLVGDYRNWYLDCGHGQWLDFRPETSASFYPYQDYCSPRKSWRQIYAFDPIAGISPTLTSLVLGGEVHMWSEQTDEADVDRKIWPRAAAAAEVLWSGAKDGEGRNRSQIEASPRLAEMRERLLARGVQAEPVQMPYCTQESEACVL